MGLTGRNATIAIWNWLGSDLTLLEYTLIHGKFQKDLEPPPVIGAYGMGCFAVGNHTAEPIGPKGILRYNVRGQSFTLSLTWDHPFSGAASAYYCFSEGPDGKIDAVLFPNQPSGEDQQVNWTVRPRS